MSTGTDWTNWRSPYDDGRDKTVMIDRDEALAGRGEPLPVRARHPVLGTPLTPPFPAGTRTLVVALGCLWGAERHFWTVDGVHTTAAGYAGGYTRNPTYEQVCSARTGHAESVLIVYNPAQVGVERLLGRFWEGHDPTQGMRQGHDVGTQYRSAIFYSSDHQRAAALRSRDVFQSVLHASGYGEITTAIRPLDTFFYAEEFHQQLLAREPGGYCGAGGTGLSCPIGLDVPTPPENH